MNDRPLSPGEILDQFFSAMADAGVAPADQSMMVADGALHRFHVEGEKRGSKNGWFVLHGDGLPEYSTHAGLPAGEFGTWKDAGASHTWHANIGRELSAAEQAETRRRIEAARAARAAELDAEREKGRKKAARLWAEARPTVRVTHPYLVTKCVRPYGIRQLREQLLIPVRDAAGELHGLQFIQPDGSKKFGTGTAKAGRYHAIGKPKSGAVLGIAEGFATAATVHELTGWPVAVAFDAGNLRPVAEALRAKLPGVRLVILADNDHGTEGNPGMTKAREAAAAVGGIVIAPEFEPGESGTDWNDACAAWGAERARAALLRGVEATPAAEAQACAQAAPVAPAAARAAPAANDAHAPGRKVLKFPDRKAAQKPAARKSRDEYPPGFTVDDEGVWFRGGKGKGADEPPIRVCPPLRVLAYLRDTEQDNWGLLLEWEDRDGRTHQWALPESMFKGSGEEMRGELLRQGFRVPMSSDKRGLFLAYLDQAQPSQHARSVEKTGWHGEGAERVFVLPNGTIGKGGEPVYFQSESLRDRVYRSEGDLAAWRTDVADLCRGNSRLVFGVSMAFASMLMFCADDESGGVQMVGDSSAGKSTVQYVAASVFGGPSFVEKWKATANSIEAVAFTRNDALLILDDIKNVDPAVAGECVFTLAGGVSKNRMHRTTALRPKMRWRLLFLSTAEKKLATHMAEAKKSPDAGHGVRMAEFAAEVRPGTVFETNHGYSGGAEFSNALRAAAAQSYGTAAPAFIEAVLRLGDKLPDELRAARAEFCRRVLPSKVDGQAQRVASRFALFAYSGEGDR